ncbi:hypothetical protein KY284_026835 [Solanum tuberosum]|nr:hypothetical protein KY284_026835 [Solanum tuberosum]
MLMHGHNLYGHLDGSIPSPTRTISQNNQDVANPEFALWYRQDQLIQNAIWASIDATLTPIVDVAISAKAAWDALHTAYANKSQTRFFNLRDRLARLTNDSRPVADYLRQIRSLCDELLTVGAPVSNSELVVKILSGLGSEFREFSTAIRARDSTISYEELCKKLLDHELFPKYEDDKKPLSTNITTAIAQKTSSTPHCHGHSAGGCRSQSHNHLQAWANFAGCFPPQQTPWIVDSGATHHIASDAQSLDAVHDYHGTEDITMGNGQTIPISQTGNANISASNHHFKLLNTLCSPLIKTNLTSVSQFCHDNHSSIEFFPFHYLVKDLNMGASLVRGQNKDGLYEWPTVCTHVLLSAMWLFQFTCGIGV